MMRLSDSIKFCFRVFLICTVMLCGGTSAFGQQQPPDSINLIDSARLQKFNADSVKKYFKASDTLIAYQLNKVEAYTKDFNKINKKLRRGFDTSFITRRLPDTDSILSIASTNLEGFRGHASLKILWGTKSMLVQQQDLLEKWQEELGKYNADLNAIRDKIKAISNDSGLLVMPTDSLLFSEYIKKLKPLGAKIESVDSITSKQLSELGVLQNRISTNYLSATDLLDEASYQITGFENRIFDNEFGYLWEHHNDPSYKKNFQLVVQRSLSESKTLLGIYASSNWGSRLIVLAIGILFYFLMRRNIRKIKKQSDAPETVFAKANHIPRHLLASTIVFGLMLIPFIYKEAPQSFTQSLWAVQVIAMVFLIRKKLNVTLSIQILLLLILFYITSFANLLIETTYGERWIQLFISLVSVGLGSWIWLDKKENHFSKTSFYKILTAVFVIMNLLAFLFNLTGRVTLAKVLNTGANYGMIEAINLLIFVEIIIDALYLSLEASKKSSRLTAFFEFKGMELKMRKALGFFAGLIWVVIFTQNVHIYEAIFGNISEVLSKVRSIGSLEFTLQSIVIFLAILWVSTLIAQMVSFIFSGNNNANPNTGKSKLGSTILLVRLGIYCAGALLAFGASGIPLDKLTLIIGALGVGIGFGLQNIVNNLVSGIVLAFEKPVQIGDTIEVGTLSGIVKEVGIRSSKLTSFDGSEVIIPNGDMLSKHLINWTNNNQDRRTILEIGVAYGSNISEVKAIIFDVIKNTEHIFTLPEPMINVQNFGDNAVDLKVYFWSDNDHWLIIRSELMGNIYNALNERGIGIPFPQRDLHIKSVDVDVLNKINNPK